MEILIEKGGNIDVRNNDGESVRMILTKTLPEARPTLKEKIEVLLKKLEDKDVEKKQPELKVWTEQPLISALKQSRLKKAFILNLIGGKWNTR